MQVTETAMGNGQGRGRLGSGQDHTNTVQRASLGHTDCADDWLPKLELFFITPLPVHL